MAIVKTLTPGENTFLLIWKITEDAGTLKNLVSTIRDEQTQTPRTNLHWLASRAALRKHFAEAADIMITKDAYNKPGLTVDGVPYRISITHSNQYAAVLVSRSHDVSIDLEKIDLRVERVARKFVNTAEEEMLLGSLNSTLDLTRIWSAKETLYKLYGKKELDFRMHMTVFINNLKTLRGCIHKSGPVFYEIRHGQIEDYIYTYICC